MTDRLSIRGGEIFDGIQTTPRLNSAVVFENGRIVDIVDADQAAGMSDVIAEADIIAPGFIDLQLNGAGGVLFNDAPDVETLRIMAKAARKTGTCYFFPTFITDQGDGYRGAMTAVQHSRGSVPEVIGLHLEGPFLSPARPGIHPVDCIRAMTEHDLAHLTAFEHPLLLTLAPEETETSYVSKLSAAGTRVFAGHSEAGFDDMQAAIKNGLCGVTHLFNAMGQITARQPGVVGSTFGSRELFAGIIADGHHVHDNNLALAYRLLGPDRLFLVTDAMSPLGTERAEFSLLGKRIFRKNGKLVDENGTLAGADLSMIDAVRYTQRVTGCTLGHAFRMATATPARAVGLEADFGTIEVGKKAGFTLLTEDLTVDRVVIDKE